MDLQERRDWARGEAEQRAAWGDSRGADEVLDTAGLRPRYGSGAEPAAPGIGTYLLGIGITLALLWPVITGFMGLVKNGVYGLAAGFPLAFLLPSIGTSPLRGFLGITTSAVIVGSLPLLLALIIGPARAPKFRAVLWMLAVLLTVLVVILGTISWNTLVRAGV
ncbi:MAG: hypothetical protein ACNYNX_10505 [Leucobacter sp.]